MKAQFYSAVRLLAGESPNFPMLVSELPRTLRDLVLKATEYTTDEYASKYAHLQLSRAGWVVDMYIGPYDCTHSLISLDGSITRYINVESNTCLNRLEIEQLFDSTPYEVAELPSAISEFVQTAGDRSRNFLSKARAQMLLRNAGWRIVEVSHPSASHLLMPLGENDCKYILVVVRKHHGDTKAMNRMSN